MLIVLAFLIAGLVALRTRDDQFPAARGIPDSRFTPLVVALASMAVIWYVWGSLNQVPVAHDEASYLLQAQTFAEGRWTMPSPPLPAFFEQFHVFVTPTFASKYPPGHGILLVPGTWLGLPGLVPVVLNGLTAAVLFLLVRRVTNSWVGLMTVMLWLTLRSNLLFRPSYFSENTSSLLWLLGWWALLEWRETAAERWLMVLAGCVSWMAITRPLTAAAFALPVGAVVVWRSARRKQWRPLIRPALLGVAVLSLLPLSNAKVTGAWRESPYSVYARDYLPFDKMGFGLDSTPPERSLPADMKSMVSAFSPIHAAHTPQHLPRILYDRWRALFVDAFGGPRRPLALFALVALVALPAVAWFAVGSSLLLTLCYLGYAHPASWVVYYLEILPLFPFLSACGIWVAWTALRRQPENVWRRSLGAVTPQAAFAGLIFCVALLVPAEHDVRQAKRLQIGRHKVQAKFTTAVAGLPDPRTVIFIRYAPDHYIHTSLIANQADLARAKTWLVYDRGPENAALMALASDRTPYLFDEGSGTLQRLAAPRLAAGEAKGVATRK